MICEADLTEQLSAAEPEHDRKWAALCEKHYRLPP